MVSSPDGKFDYLMLGCLSRAGVVPPLAVDVVVTEAEPHLYACSRIIEVNKLHPRSTLNVRSLSRRVELPQSLPRSHCPQLVH